jgi:hypothetical protein
MYVNIIHQLTLFAYKLSGIDLADNLISLWDSDPNVDVAIEIRESLQIVREEFIRSGFSEAIMPILERKANIKGIFESKLIRFLQN